MPPGILQGRPGIQSTSPQHPYVEGNKRSILYQGAGIFQVPICFFRVENNGSICSLFAVISKFKI